MQHQQYRVGPVGAPDLHPLVHATEPHVPVFGDARRRQGESTGDRPSAQRDEPERGGDHDGDATEHNPHHREKMT
jgi:hypothetical protein